MKKQLLLFVMMLLPIMASADAVEIDGIYYNLITKAKIAEVTSNPNKYSGSVIIPEKVTYNGNEYNVTSIGKLAFRYCSGMTSVSIPNSVTSIGSSAFSGCSGLTSVTLPNSLTSIDGWGFSGCRGLTEATIPNNVTTIGDNVFEDCKGLISATIGNCVSTIGSDVFKNCTELTTVTMGSGITFIGASAFAGCKKLTTVYLHDLASWCKVRCSTANSNPFYYAERIIINDEEINDLVIPEGVTSIGDNNFANCSVLTSISLPTSLSTINNSAFRDCKNITSVRFAEGSISVIGSGAFWECNSLASVNISSLEAWCKISFGDATSNPLIYAHHLYLNNEEIKDLIIPGSIETINDYAFYECNFLSSVTMHAVKSIGEYAFKGCSGLTEVTMSNNLNHIGLYAFNSCSGLIELVLPNSINSVRGGAFSECSSLKKVIIGENIQKIGFDAYGYGTFEKCPELTDVFCYSSKIPSASSNIFNNSDIEYATLHVKAALIDSYSTQTPWKDFGSIVALQDGDPNPTGIELATCERHHTDNYYNLSGQQVTKPQKGIFITNGKKVIVK